MVHHDEHVFDAVVFFTDQITYRTLLIAVGQHAGGTSVYAELVLDRHAFDLVAITKRAIRIHEKLRHDEERNTFHAFRRRGRAREHQMDNVLRHLVLAPGDEDLGAPY